MKKIMLASWLEVLAIASLSAGAVVSWLAHQPFAVGEFCLAVSTLILCILIKPQ